MRGPKNRKSRVNLGRAGQAIRAPSSGMGRAWPLGASWCLRRKLSGSSVTENEAAKYSYCLRAIPRAPQATGLSPSCLPGCRLIPSSLLYRCASDAGSNMIRHEDGKRRKGRGWKLEERSGWKCHAYRQLPLSKAKKLRHFLLKNSPACPNREVREAEVNSATRFRDGGTRCRRSSLFGTLSKTEVCSQLMWNVFTPCTTSDSLLEALMEVAKSAASDDVILFLPTHPSLAEYRNHQRHGTALCRTVKSICSGVPCGTHKIDGRKVITAEKQRVIKATFPSIFLRGRLRSKTNKQSTPQ